MSTGSHSFVPQDGVTLSEYQPPYMVEASTHALRLRKYPFTPAVGGITSSQNQLAHAVAHSK